MELGPLKDRENFDQGGTSLTSGNGYFSSYGSIFVRGIAILFGRTTMLATTSSITPRMMSLKSGEIND